MDGPEWNGPGERPGRSGGVAVTSGISRFRRLRAGVGWRQAGAGQAGGFACCGVGGCSGLPVTISGIGRPLCWQLSAGCVLAGQRHTRATWLAARAGLPSGHSLHGADGWLPRTLGQP